MAYMYYMDPDVCSLKRGAIELNHPLTHLPCTISLIRMARECKYILMIPKWIAQGKGWWSPFVCQDENRPYGRRIVIERRDPPEEPVSVSERRDTLTSTEDTAELEVPNNQESSSALSPFHRAKKHLKNFMGGECCLRKPWRIFCFTTSHNWRNLMILNIDRNYHYQHDIQSYYMITLCQNFCWLLFFYDLWMWQSYPC